MHLRKWFWRLLAAAIVVLLFLFGYLAVSSRAFSGTIPRDATAAMLLPAEAPYFSYLEDLSPDILTWFNSRVGMNDREFIKAAGFPYSDAVLNAPGLQTEVDPKTNEVNTVLLEMCGTQVGFALHARTGGEPGALGFLGVGKMRLGCLPPLLAQTLLSKEIPGLSWKTGERGIHNGYLDGKLRYAFSIESGWFLVSDSPAEIAAALDRAKSGNSLAHEERFKKAIAEQSTRHGFLLFTQVKPAMQFLSDTKAPANVDFADKVRKSFPQLETVNWGWFPDYANRYGRDVFFYGAAPEAAQWLITRYPPIRFATAPITSKDTFFYAPFSLPLKAIAQGDLFEMPGINGAAKAWLEALGGAEVLSGEAALVIDKSGQQAGFTCLALHLAQPAAVANRLTEWAVSGQGPNLPGVFSATANAPGIGLETALGSYQLAVQDSFLLVTANREALRHFTSKKPGPTMLDQRIARFAEDRGRLPVSGAVFYDARAILLDWQSRARGHWQALYPLIKAKGLAVTETPPDFAPDQILEGGAALLTFDASGATVRHNFDKPPRIDVTITRIAMASSLIFGADRDQRINWFCTMADGRPGGWWAFFINDILRAYQINMPLVKSNIGGMAFDPMLAIGFAAALPVLPDAPASQQ